MTLDPGQRAALFQAKLRGLVAREWGPASVDEGKSGTFPGGATLCNGSDGWVLAEEQPQRALGRALAWSLREGTETLHLLVSASAGLAARRAAYFARPPQVWAVERDRLVPARAEPLVCAPDLPVGAAPLAGLIRDAGADPVVEHGDLRGEVLGLQVARAARHASTNGGWWLDVGVGRYDREATRLIHGEEGAAQALRRAVAEIRRHRRPGTPTHPANQLARERWLRAVLLQRPDLIGAGMLVAVDPPTPIQSVSAPAVAPALGEDSDGTPLLAVCSTGVDLELVPEAADARALHESVTGGALRLVLVVPAGDDHPVTGALAATLERPAEVRTVPRDWPALGG